MMGMDVDGNYHETKVTIDLCICGSDGTKVLCVPRDVCECGYKPDHFHCLCCGGRIPEA